jgi:hypothetical protein
VGENNKRQGRTSDGWLLVTDSAGNPVFGKIYGDKYEYEAFFSVYPTFDGGYVMGGRRWHWGRLNPAEKGVYNYDPIVYKVDSAGKLEWSYLHDTHYDDMWASVIQTSDSNYVFCGTISDTSIGNTPRGQPFLFKLDRQGKLLWKKGYNRLRHHNYLLKVMELPGGKLISCGVTGDYQPQKGLLLLTDANGNVIFEESYENDSLGTQSWNRLFDVEPMPDGGFMAAGEVFATGPVPFRQDPWIIRVDSMGCIKSNCLVGLGQVETAMPSGQIYPNPGNGVFSVESEHSIAELQVYDLQGKRVAVRQLSNGQWEIEAPAGLYLVRIKEEGKAWRSGKLIKQQ